jgi:hypothetical protein
MKEPSVTLTEFLRGAIKNQHRMLDQSIRDLTPEQMHFVPPGTTANHIGFTIWHYVRTEDNIVQFILQDRKPTIWVAAGYHERWSLEKVVQGTGMILEQAQSMRLPSIDAWMEYQQSVWTATDDYLASADDTSLDRVVKVVPFGEIPAHRALSMPVLTHGHGHLGEICVLRVLQGLKSSLI